MKKLLLTPILILTLMLTFQLSAKAAGVGYVNYSKIVTSYPLAVKYKKELEGKADAIKKYVTQKETEIKNAKDATSRENIRKQAVAEIEKRDKEYGALKTTRENEVEAKLKAASEKVRNAKKLDIMLRSDTVVSGGVDCTNDILKELGR